jgi:hypothetical protein
MLPGSTSKQYVQTADGLCPQQQNILYSNVLLGKVQLRQFRAAPDTDCSEDNINKQAPNFRTEAAGRPTCYKRWSLQTQDKQTYGNSTNNPNGYSFKTGLSVVKGSIHFVENLLGLVINYGEGGYVYEMPRNLSDWNAALKDLQANYVDAGTRCLVFSFNIYNQNLDHYSVRARPGRLSDPSVFLCKSFFYGAFVWRTGCLTELMLSRLSS